MLQPQKVGTAQRAAHVGDYVHVRGHADPGIARLIVDEHLAGDQGRGIVQPGFQRALHIGLGYKVEH